MTEKHVTAGKQQSNRYSAETYHSADGATDGVGLELTIEASGHLVNLQDRERWIRNARYKRYTI